jgi:hypothetical protein
MIELFLRNGRQKQETDGVKPVEAAEKDPRDRLRVPG